ncbi:MAG: hypothetical protein LRY74_01670 [Shewanella xiamenensis]|nr:hypothetical protein [Shewanella xiamenensis]
MHHQYLNEPMILDVAQTSSLIITLPSNMSDFIVLETMGAPLLELIVVSQTPPQIAVRLQPILGLKLNTTSVADAGLSAPVSRCLGQGVRLYHRMGTAPKFVAQELRAGILIKVDVRESVTFSLQSASKFEFVTLESTSEAYMSREY